MTTQNVNALTTVGYLNNMTGHLWSLTEQPNAADEPGLYEPLVLSREALAEVQQKDALQLSVDNILRGLDITGDGSVTQLVLEKFIAIQAERDALAAENVALKEATDGHYYWEDGGDGLEEPESFASNGEMKVGEEFELATGVEIGYTRFRVLNDEHDIEILSAPLQTPATDAAIAEIGANAVEAEFSRTPDAEIKWDGTNLTVQNVRDGFSFGVTPVFVAANLRAGRKG